MSNISRLASSHSAHPARSGVLIPFAQPCQHLFSESRIFFSEPREPSRTLAKASPQKNVNSIVNELHRRTLRSTGAKRVSRPLLHRCQQLSENFFQKDATENDNPTDYITLFGCILQGAKSRPPLIHDLSRERSAAPSLAAVPVQSKTYYQIYGKG